MKKVDHIKLNVDKDKPEKGAIVVFADGTTQNVNIEFALREKGKLVKTNYPVGVG